jgi:hypothetical protein
MSFMAQCTFCNAQMRIPDQALGWSVPCPKCHNSFTAAPLPLGAATAAGGPRLDPSETTALPAPRPQPAAMPRAAAPRAVADPPGTLATTTAAAVPTLDAVPRAASLSALPPERTFRRPDLPKEPDAVPERMTTGNVLGVVALFLAAAALVLASLASVDFLTLPLASLGLLMGIAAGLAALAFGKGGLLLPGAGSAANLLVLLLALLWPGLFNILSFGRGAAGADAGRIQAIPLDHANSDASGLEQAGWVDASRAAIQQDDVRVQVTAVSVGPVEVSRVQSKPRFTAEKYLLVRLRTTNVGAGRQLPYDTWNAAGQSEQPPVLTDNSGKRYALKSAEADWKMTEQPQRAPLSPGRFADELLVFEPPPADVDYLHLELPAAACGGRDTYHLAIPRALIRH